MQFMLYLPVHSGDASVPHHPVPGMLSHASPPRNAFPNAFKKFCERTTQIVNKTEDWPVKFSALLDKLQQHCFCALKPDKTNLVNQQELLWNSNQGAPAQDWVGRVVGYAVAHDQDRDSDIHKSSAALGKRPASALSRPVRRSQVR